MTNTQKYSISMEGNAKKLLSPIEDYVFSAIDNNQKGFPKNHQRFGVSNNFEGN